MQFPSLDFTESPPPGTVGSDAVDHVLRNAAEHGASTVDLVSDLLSMPVLFEVKPALNTPQTHTTHTNPLHPKHGPNLH